MTNLCNGIVHLCTMGCPKSQIVSFLNRNGVSCLHDWSLFANTINYSRLSQLIALCPMQPDQFYNPSSVLFLSKSLKCSSAFFKCMKHQIVMYISLYALFNVVLFLLGVVIPHTYKKNHTYTIYQEHLCVYAHTFFSVCLCIHIFYCKCVFLCIYVFVCVSMLFYDWQKCVNNDIRMSEKYVIC